MRAERRESAAQRRDALEGVRVVEFGAFAAGPVVGKYLGELGAQVIRVESGTRPDGFRAHYPPYKDGRPGLDRGGTFALCNNDSLSVTLNLKQQRAVELARRLVAMADVVIENFVPGVMKGLGLDYAALSEANPGLVMLSTCNQGQTGPRAVQPGFGSQLSSMSGFTHLTGYSPDEQPMFLYGPYIDFIAAGYGLVAVLAALHYRRRTGEGQYIDLSQYESGAQFLIPPFLDVQLNDRVQTRQANRNPRAAPHGAYPCKGEDAWCVIAVFEEDEWQALCRAAGHPEWADDPRLATAEARKQNEEELDAVVSGWTRQLERDQVMERLQAAGVRAGMVLGVADLYSCPQLAERRQWQAQPHREFGSFEYLGPVYLLSKTPGRVHRPSPCLGEHNREILGGLLGLSDDELARLQADGVVA